jgi:hypothetical protein
MEGKGEIDLDNLKNIISIAKPKKIQFGSYSSNVVMTLMAASKKAKLDFNKKQT